MLTIDEGYISSRVEIMSMDNVLLSGGRIEDITEDYIQVECSTNMPVLYYRTYVKMNVFNRQLGFCVLIGMVYISAKGFIRISEALCVQNEERRRYFRVSARVPIFLYPPGFLREEKEEKRIKAITVDLSYGGALIECTEKLEGTYEIEIPLKNDICSFTIEVLREKEAEDEEKQHFACEFISPESRNNDKLCKWLLDIQRDQARGNKHYRANQ